MTYITTFRHALRGALVPALVAIALSQGGTALAQDDPGHFSVEVSGEGSDVIFIPGLSTPRDVWDATAEHLGEGYRIHLVQVRGFGEHAGANAEGPILQPMVGELATYIEEHELEHPALVGHSLGGLISLMLAAEHPDMPGKLLVVDALPWFGAIFGNGAASVETMESQAAMMRDMLKAQAGTPMPPQALAATARSQALEEESREAVASYIARADPRVTGQLLYEDITTDMREDVALITAPITVLVPFAPPAVTEESALQLYSGEYAAAQDVTIRTVGPAGHFLMLDQKEAFLAELDAFLER